MSRIIYIAGILILVWFAFRYFRTQIQEREKKQTKKKSFPIKDVKPCSFCGLHIPVEELVHKDKHSFCSYQHMQEYEDKMK